MNFDQFNYSQLMRLARAAKRDGLITFKYTWVTKEDHWFSTTYTNNYSKLSLVRILAKHINRIKHLDEYKVLSSSTQTSRVRITAKGGEFTSKTIEELFPDVIGMDNVKKTIYETIYVPFVYKDAAKKYNVTTTPGLLFYGPPGNGKTYIVTAFCNACGFSLIMLSATALMTKWFGDTEKLIREKFERAEKNAPSIIVIDEIDAIVPSRDAFKSAEFGHVNEFLAQLDGIKRRQFVALIGTTNRVESIDKAILRSGRLDMQIKVENPQNAMERENILRGHLQHVQTGKLNLKSIVNKLKDASRADLANIIRTACKRALMREVHSGREQKVENADIEIAVKEVMSSQHFI